MTAAAVVAASAATEALREEEEMANYSKQDLDDGWEFKFLRSATGKFRDPVWQRAILEEEARAGWTLLEKFDNTRMRLKRPASAREGDATAAVDPYRIWVGAKPSTQMVFVVAGVLAGVGVFVALVITLLVVFVNRTGPH